MAATGVMYGWPDCRPRRCSRTRSRPAKAPPIAWVTEPEWSRNSAITASLGLVTGCVVISGRRLDQGPGGPAPQPLRVLRVGRGPEQGKDHPGHAGDDVPHDLHLIRCGLEKDHAEG